MKTYNLLSSPFVYAPSVVSMAVNEWSFRPKWATELISSAWNLPPAAAKALVSGKAEYQIKDDGSVTFTIDK